MSVAFLWPGGWPLLALAPALWIALRAGDRARTVRLAQIVGTRIRALVPGLSERRRSVRRALVAGGLLFAIVAVLQPVWGERVGAAEERGIELVVCLDVSRSMLARDEPPSRLVAAQREIRALAEKVRGDRLALVVFAGEARVFVPSTRDMKTFAEISLKLVPLLCSSFTNFFVDKVT